MRSDVPELSSDWRGSLLARKAIHPGTLTDLSAFLTEHSEFRPDMARHLLYRKDGRNGAVVDRTLWKLALGPPDAPPGILAARRTRNHQHKGEPWTIQLIFRLAVSPYPTITT